MTAPREARFDASTLPDVAFGPRSPLWWGSAGFIAIEATTLAVCLASYLYLMRNFLEWPPRRTPLPSLAIYSIGTLLALLSLVPSVLSSRYARRFDSNRTRLALYAHTAMGLLLLAWRGLEFTQTGTRWDEHAYGSIVWTTLVVHAIIVLTDVADTVFIAIVFGLRRAEKKHYAGIVDNDLYWRFVVASWVVTYAVLVLGPRVTQP